jgi:hypothetical protein
MSGSPPLLVYAIGLEPLLARALYADLPHATIRRKRPLRSGVTFHRRGPRPTLVVLDVAATLVVAELAAAWSAWGDDVLIVGVDRRGPLACIWRRPDEAEFVEIGPGFLARFLSAPTGVVAARSD